MLSKTEVLRSLKGSHFFSEITPGALILLAEALEIESFDQGEDVCVTGECADRIYIVHSGTLAVLIPGEQEPVSRLGKGDVLGEYGMFIGVRTSSVKAETAAVLLSMDYARFNSFLMQNPAVMYELFNVTVERLLRIEKSLRELREARAT